MDNTLAVISLIGVIVGVTLLLVSLIVGVTLVAADQWRHLAKPPEVPRIPERPNQNAKDRVPG
jgi:UPF0716 family protein affecting phage T7 exclusion